MNDYVFYILVDGKQIEYTWVKTLTHFTLPVYVFRRSTKQAIGGVPELLHAKGIGGEMQIMDEDPSLGTVVYKELAPIVAGAYYLHHATKARAKVLAVGHHMTEGTPMVGYYLEGSTSILGGVLFLDTTQFYKLYRKEQL
jgi:hypothetical protein